MRDKKGRFKKGKSGNPKTQFKKGHMHPDKTKKKLSKGMKKAYEEGRHTSDHIKHREKHQCWKGGKKIWQGYVYINKGRNHPMADKDGYVAEHRLVMAAIIGRPLKPSELVHHKNGMRDDNSPKNLEIVTRRKHKGEVFCPYCENKFMIE